MIRLQLDIDGLSEWLEHGDLQNALAVLSVAREGLRVSELLPLIGSATYSPEDISGVVSNLAPFCEARGQEDGEIMVMPLRKVRC